MRKLIRLGFVLCIAALPALNASSATANPTHPNGQILFARYDPTLDDTVLYTVNPDGSHKQQVVPFGVECPHWSPDGSRIAKCGTVSYLWTPDAKRLACDAGSDSDPSRNGIYTIRTADGRGLTRITSNPFGEDVPGEYSPNGK